MSRLALAAVVLLGCGRRETGSLPSIDEAAVIGPVAQFADAGRTASAFTRLAVALTDAAVGDPAVAPTAEVRLLGLAAPLAETWRSRPIGEQASTLALTVWPVLLAEPLHGERSAVDLSPQQGESVDDYLTRLCAGPLRQDCGGIGGQERAIVVRAIAMRNADERMQAALSTCLSCRDHAWVRLGWMWKSLDREATGSWADLQRYESRAHVVAVKQ